MYCAVAWQADTDHDGKISLHEFAHLAEVIRECEALKADLGIGEAQLQGR